MIVRTSGPDVVVVGAGPAGSSLAARLAANGHEVWCLDACDFPREKACGDCLNPGAVAALARLGALERIQRETSPRLLRGWRIRSLEGAAFETEYGRGMVGWGVRRRELDASLVRIAEGRGARFFGCRRIVDLLRRGTRVVGVVVRGGDGRWGWDEIQAPLVVGADGLRSTVAGRLGLVARPPVRRKIALVAHLPDAAGAVDGLGELWVAAGPNDAGTRCVGLAPLGDGSLNVTCVWSDDDRGSSARARWVSIVETFPEVARRLRGHALEGRLMASGPFDRPVRRAAWPGALLVGDAAGYYDPFTGEGIYRALRSAELAEPYALDFLATGSVTALTEYDRAIRSDLRWGRWLEGVVERIVHEPVAFGAAAAILSRYPALAGALLRRVGDAPWAP